MDTSATLFKCGLYDETTIKGLWKDYMASYSEGYVIRVIRQFNFFEFKSCVSKFVRKNHVQTNKHHWMFNPNFSGDAINKLKDNINGF